MTLTEFSRALAAHALITAYPHELHEFFAPEKAEHLATFIERFATGVPVARPEPKERDD